MVSIGFKDRFQCERLDNVLALSVFQTRKRTHFHTVVCAVIAAFMQGCSPDADILDIDFSKTIAIEQPAEQKPEYRYFRVAVSARVSPKEIFGQYRKILDYIGDELDLEIQLIQRKTYGEINALFGKGEIDLAFVCSGSYATEKETYGFEAFAVPQIRGGPYYQSYLIVKKDSPFYTLEDLKGRVFAFTDPGSNTGSLVPTFWLKKMGKKPGNFFKKVIYTYGHDNSILAVAKSLVDGATVDGHIWEYYNLNYPLYTSKTRIVKKSGLFGNPPLVVTRYLSTRQKERIRKLIFSMHLKPEGKQILDDLMIDRYVAPDETWYDTIRRMNEFVHKEENETEDISKS